MTRLACLLALLLAAAPAHAAAEPRPLTLSQAVELALSSSSELGGAAAATDAAEARTRGAKALRLPRLSANGNVTYWDKAITFDLGAALPQGLEFDNTIREQLTASASLTINQPLSGLFVLSNLVSLEKHGAAAARASQASTRLAVAARAAETYLRALQARAAETIAAKSVAQLDAQLERARVLERGGVLGAVDVLRLESARDQARQAELKAVATARTADRALARLVGWEQGTPLALTDDLPAELPPPPQDEEKAAQAAAHRPEVTAAAERVSQAEKGRKVAQADYLPNIQAQASYQHNEGMGTLQAADSWFVGVTLQWDLWDWGKTRAAVAEAAALRRQAEAGLQQLSGDLEVEARRRALEAQAAYQALALAGTAQKAGEEAYRIQTVRFNEGTATTTDLLEAETEVLRARVGVAVTRYDYLISLVALARAAGEEPALSR